VERLTGDERLDIVSLDRIMVGNNAVPIAVTRVDGSNEAIETNLRIDSEQELTYLRNGGILPTSSARRSPGLARPTGPERYHHRAPKASRSSCISASPSAV
jgi:hypothetical protein